MKHRIDVLAGTMQALAADLGVKGVSLRVDLIPLNEGDQHNGKSAIFNTEAGKAKMAELEAAGFTKKYEFDSVLNGGCMQACFQWDETMSAWYSNNTPITLNVSYALDKSDEIARLKEQLAKLEGEN